MGNSFILGSLIKFYRRLETYYKHSLTNKLLNIILAKLRGYFVNSILYRIGTFNHEKEDHRYQSSIFHFFQTVSDRIISMLHHLWIKGAKGSKVINWIGITEEGIVKNISGFIAFLMIGSALSYMIILGYRQALSINTLSISLGIIVIALLVNRNNLKKTVEHSRMIILITKIFSFDSEE